MKNLLFILLTISALSLSAFAQTKNSAATIQSVKSSAAYAELLLRKTELDSEMESLLITYTAEFPKVKESKYELELIQKDLEKILTQTDASKLTLALGKMLVKRITFKTDLWILQSRLGAEHPDVKRAQRKVLTFDNAIKEIMP